MFAWEISQLVPSRPNLRLKLWLVNEMKTCDMEELDINLSPAKFRHRKSIENSSLSVEDTTARKPRNISLK
jgi:hypothetical protein